jgi:hypothetical protein
MRDAFPRERVFVCGGGPVKGGRAIHPLVARVRNRAHRNDRR